jgi:hypothetical protein
MANSAHVVGDGKPRAHKTMRPKGIVKNITINVRETGYKNEEWCLLGCYAVWLL